MDFKAIVKVLFFSLADPVHPGFCSRTVYVQRTISQVVLVYVYLKFFQPFIANICLDLFELNPY